MKVKDRSSSSFDSGRLRTPTIDTIIQRSNLLWSDHCDDKLTYLFWYSPTSQLCGQAMVMKLRTFHDVLWRFCRIYQKLGRIIAQTRLDQRAHEVDPRWRDHRVKRSGKRYRSTLEQILWRFTLESTESSSQFMYLISGHIPARSNARLLRKSLSNCQMLLIKENVNFPPK